MYIAELKGKLSSKLENSEDVLTSNVFSFFKYADRKIFLKSLLSTLKITTKEDDLLEAKFIFWPVYQDKTEPDLVIIVGDYYLLFEAKYFSDFGKGTKDKETQLQREFNEGLKEATSYNKNFLLIALTAHYSYPAELLKDTHCNYAKYLKWINWQSITEIILKHIETNNVTQPYYDFANDLYLLLDKKNLRGFLSFNRLKLYCIIDPHDEIFFSSKTANFRGGFIGFGKVLSGLYTISNFETIFFKKI